MSKATLVLVHGWGMHAAFWEPIVPRLEQNYTVICPDLPGHGLRSSLQCPKTLLALIEAILEVCPKQGRLVWVGWSLGGLIALAASFFFPERVSRLVTVGASFCFEADNSAQTKDWGGLDKAVLDRFERVLYNDAEESLKRLLALQVHGTPAASQTLQQLHRLLEKRPRANHQALINGFTLLRHTNLRNDLVKVKQPVLLMAGENDYFLSETMLLKTRERLLNGRFESIKGAGHAPFVSHPQEFVRMLNNFIVNGNE